MPHSNAWMIRLTQIVFYGRPIGEFGRTELNPFTTELFGTILRTVVDKIISVKEFLVMADDEAFVEKVMEVRGYPPYLVTPG